MKLRQISSFDELQNELKETDRLFLLLYKSDSDQSECALNNLKYTKSALDIRLVTADVRSARDIHGNYHIDSVPALLQFDQGKLGKVFKGCHEPDFFKSLFENFPDFKQNNTQIATFGPKTAKAVKDAGLKVNVKAPTKEAPSMTMAIDQFINVSGKSKK